MAAPKLSDGDNGGNNGGKINNGGGGSSGKPATAVDRRRRGRRRRRYISLREGIPETFEREAIQAVLSEWFKHRELTGWFKNGSRDGRRFSAQLVRFMSVDVRPSVAESYQIYSAVGL